VSDVDCCSASKPIKSSRKMNKKKFLEVHRLMFKPGLYERERERERERVKEQESTSESERKYSAGNYILNEKYEREVRYVVNTPWGLLEI
jgi:hypothetical protein